MNLEDLKEEIKSLREDGNDYFETRIDDFEILIDRLIAVVESAQSFKYNFEAADAFPSEGVEIVSSCQCCANNQALMDELKTALKALEEK